MKYIIDRVREYMKRKAVRARFRKAVSVLCCLVVFVTTYALVLPSLALEKEATCGMEEHEHTSDCYTRELVCGQEESKEHEHTDKCYEDVLSCGKEVHVHTEDCFPKDEPEEAVDEEAEDTAQEEAEEASEEPAVEETVQVESEETVEEEPEGTVRTAQEEAEEDTQGEPVQGESAQEEADDAGQDQDVDDGEYDDAAPDAGSVKSSGKADDQNESADAEQEDADKKSADDSTADGKTYEVSASGDTYEVILAYGAESGLPAEGVTLSVSEIVPEDDGFDDYLTEANDAVGDSKSVSNLKLFDIKILVKGKEVEPTGPVNVSINMKDMQVRKNEDVQVIHFQEEGETEVLDSDNVQVLNSRDGEKSMKTETPEAN